MTPQLLIVDDDPGIRNLLQSLAEDHGWRTTGVGNGAEGLAALKKGLPDLLLLDLGLPDGNGIDFLRAWQSLWPGLPTVVITGSTDLDGAVQCMQLGAYDYVVKPFAVQELIGILASALQRSSLERETRSLREDLENGRGLKRLLGTSKVMQELRDKLAQVAGFEIGVLLRGESGTGKEAAAEAIHALSRRAQEPFVSVDCGALPGSLLESELFGHEKGAFTGAAFRKRGRVEAADGGVLFLDEIANLPLALQPKLLRFLQQRDFQRLGGRETLKVDVRVVAASNVDLRTLVAQGRFRQDLYYRLAEIEVVLPTLAQRGNDIVELARAFILRYSSQFGRRAPRLSDAAAQRLLQAAWPGNVRELLNCVRSACLLAAKEILPEHLSMEAPQGPVESWQGEKLADVIAREQARVEGIMLKRALGQGERPLSTAAKDLGVDIKTLHAIMERQSVVLP